MAHGEHGVYAHVLAATDDDGWEWEGSTYYHAFVLRAYLLALRNVEDGDLPRPVLDRLRAMVDVLATVSTIGGLVPALHDSPYARPDTEAEYAELWSLLVERGWDTPTPGRPSPCTRASATRSCAGAAFTRSSTSDHTRLARPPRQAGAVPLRRHHGVAARPGTVPYGHAFWREHYASTTAHPTFRVDGAEQAECAGTLLGADETGVEVAVESAYPGCGQYVPCPLWTGQWVWRQRVDDQEPAWRSSELRVLPDVAASSCLRRY